MIKITFCGILMFIQYLIFEP